LRVLLLEPGPRPYRSLHVSAPAALTKLFQSKWDWKFTSQDEQHTSAGRGLYLCRGKALGGSSNTNALLYHRGSPADFAAWEAAGGPEWSAENLLPYFKRAEDFHPDAAVTAAAAAAPTPSGSAQPPAGVDARWHGVGGPVPVSTPPYQNPLSRGFLAACASLGFVANPDFNDWSRPQAGVGRFQVTAKRGKRFSAARAYLWESRNRFPLFGVLRSRRSLRVRTGFRATRVLFDTLANDAQRRDPP
jgi:choline dehydrogenase-like flavoprotein